MTADFSVDNTTPEESETINFTDSTDETPTSWCWDFGDGNTSILQNPSHSYAVAGQYTVKLLSAKDGLGDLEEKTNYIDVQPPSFDSDAQAFFDAVDANGGSLTTTEKTAVDTYVIALKAAGL